MIGKSVGQAGSIIAGGNRTFFLILALWTAFLAMPGILPAQAGSDSTDLTDGVTANPQTWLEFYLIYPATDKLEFFGDASYRHRHLKGARFSRFTLRPSARYRFKDWIWGGGGLMVLYTVKESLANDLEFRLWQGLQVKWPRLRWPSGKTAAFSHYLRFEERWVFDGSMGQNRFTSRTRYQLGFLLPLAFREPRVSRYFFLKSSVETFLKLNNLNKEDFLQDAARIMAGGGYVINYGWTAEFNFVWQRSRTESGEIRTSDYLLRFKAIWNFLPIRASDNPGE